MTGQELAQAARRVAKEYKTLYVLGCFGAPMTEASKARWKKEYAYNRRADRAAKLEQARADTFGFDCVCFLKALLWGWSGNADHVYGGAAYASNGVPDIGEGAMINACACVSTDFSCVEPGEAVWLPGHIGIYVGDGLVAEATPAWKDGVQLTACNRDIPGYMRRDWVKHGKLPWVSYTGASAVILPDAAVKLPTLCRGDTGASVKAMQSLLLSQGLRLPRYGADGEFGSETAAALQAYRKEKGLPEGCQCDADVWRRLLGVNL